MQLHGFLSHARTYARTQHTHPHPHQDTPTQPLTPTHIHTHPPTHIHPHPHTHTHTHKHTHTHTHTHTQDRKRMTPGSTEFSGPGAISFLSGSSMYYITLTLHNTINLLNVVITVFLEHLNLHFLLHGIETSLDGWNLPNKQFQSKSIGICSLLSRVNK